MVEDSRGELYCLRLSRRCGQELVRGYLNALYGSMGLFWLGGGFGLRDTRSQVEFIAKCRRHSLGVPEVVEFGTNWLLSRYVAGLPLNDCLSTHSDKRPILNFLDGLFLAHSNGIVLEDRWGGNEIVSETDLPPENESRSNVTLRRENRGYWAEERGHLNWAGGSTRLRRSSAS